MDKHKKIARWVLAVAILMIVLLLAMSCVDIYLDGAGFTRESVAERLRIVAPNLLAAAVVGGIALAFLLSGKKSETAEKGGKEAYKSPKEGKNDKKMWCILLPLALVLIGLGAANGGARDVFVKAVNICTECIGLG